MRTLQLGTVQYQFSHLHPCIHASCNNQSEIRPRSSTATHRCPTFNGSMGFAHILEIKHLHWCRFQLALPHPPVLIWRTCDDSIRQNKVGRVGSAPQALHHARTHPKMSVMHLRSNSCSPNRNDKLKAKTLRLVAVISRGMNRGVRTKSQANFTHSFGPSTPPEAGVQSAVIA